MIMKSLSPRIKGGQGVFDLVDYGNKLIMEL